jgi:hypothetical protein
MTVYVDHEFRCHAAPGEGLAAAEADFFDGMCEEMAACYRFIPAGRTWTRADGTVFAGEMAAPFKDMHAAQAVQRIYEEMERNAAEYAAAYDEGVQSA